MTAWLAAGSPALTELASKPRAPPKLVLPLHHPRLVALHCGHTWYDTCGLGTALMSMGGGAEGGRCAQLGLVGCPGVPAQPCAVSACRQPTS